MSLQQKVAPLSKGVEMTRRGLLRNAMLTAGSVTIPGAYSTAVAQHNAVAGARALGASSYVPVLQMPNRIELHLEESEPIAMQQSGARWTAKGCAVTANRAERSTVTSPHIEWCLEAPGMAVERVHLRWSHPLPANSLKVMGDAWERSYGDLAWRQVIPERVLPWYCLSYDGRRTHGYGVQAGAGAFAFWQLDEDGISLWLDVRNGGRGVLAGNRRLRMANVITREGIADETPLDATRALCRQMCPRPRLLAGTIYGTNDWYYAYGNSSAEDILRDADLVAELSPSGGFRPYTVADEGWANRSRFPDLPGLATEIRKRGVQPGIWIRPLAAAIGSKPGLLLPDKRFATTEDAYSNRAYDPTVPEALELVLRKIREARSWGFALVKHDFSTYDLMGQWGFAMGASPALPGWSFADRSRTSAEVIASLYQSIREAAGDALVIGCNTVGQLAAGLFEAQRIGDDVSGKVWERTRRMGVNAIGFRLAQHGTFYAADPDCIPVTAQIPWELTRQWLDVVARSGAALVISPERGSLGIQQKQAIREAFALAAAGHPQTHPQDWLTTLTPEHWVAPTKTQTAPLVRDYHWLAPGGASPFGV